MKTTLHLKEDLMQAAKKRARRGMVRPRAKSKKTAGTRNGVPLLLSRGEMVTLEHVQKLADEEGI